MSSLVNILLTLGLLSVGVVCLVLVVRARWRRRIWGWGKFYRPPAAGYWGWWLGYLLLGLAAGMGGGIGITQWLGWPGALLYAWLVMALGWGGWRWWRQHVPQPQWQPLDWALAALGPLSRLRKWHWRELYGRTPQRRHRRRARRFLRREWDVRKPEQWIKTAEWLLDTGHRMAFQAEIDQILAMDEVELAVYMTAIDRGEVESLHEETATEQLARIHWIRQEGERLQEVSFLAWDLLRLMDLCRWGLLAHYIEQETAVRYLLLASQALQQRFHNWAELYQHYGQGLRYWSEPSYEAQKAALEKAIAHFQKKRRSPWRQLPWLLPLVPAEIEMRQRNAPTS
jgi:hypothetical protein